MKEKQGMGGSGLPKQQTINKNGFFLQLFVFVAVIVVVHLVFLLVLIAFFEGCDCCFLAFVIILKMICHQSIAT